MSMQTAAVPQTTGVPSTFSPGPNVREADCGNAELRELDAREELVRLASQTGCRVELVGEPGALGGFGGVGCLLRFSDWGA